MTDFHASDRDVNRVIRSWLHEDRHEDVSRVAGAVLDQLDATSRRRATWWTARRMPVMNRTLIYGLGAAAVIVALVVGMQLLGSEPGGVGDAPSQAPEPSLAEPTPDPTPEPTPEGLPVGPHLILDGVADESATILTVTIPAPGWDGEVGSGILETGDGGASEPDGAGMIIFANPEYIVYGDACNWQTTIPDAPATTVDELVAALSAQGSREASEPVDITLDGYSGKSITLEVPADVDFTECDPGYGGSWDCGGDGLSPCGYHSAADEIDTVYILDVDGVTMAWVTNYHTGTPVEVVAELEAIVESASFGE